MTNGPQYPEYPNDPNQPASQPSSQPAWGQVPPHSTQVPPNQAPHSYGIAPNGPPAPGYGYPAPVPNNGKALASMILGIISIAFCYIGMILGIVAIVLAISAKSDLRSRPGSQGGDGMATAGLITGIFGTVIWGGLIALMIGLTVAP